MTSRRLLLLLLFIKSIVALLKFFGAKADRLDFLSLTGSEETRESFFISTLLEMLLVRLCWPIAERTRGRRGRAVGDLAGSSTGDAREGEKDAAEFLLDMIDPASEEQGLRSGVGAS